MLFRMNVPETIRYIRYNMKLNQTDFCDLYNEWDPKQLRLNQPTLSRYETGLVMPPADKFAKIQDLHTNY